MFHVIICILRQFTESTALTSVSAFSTYEFIEYVFYSGKWKDGMFAL